MNLRNAAWSEKPRRPRWLILLAGWTVLLILSLSVLAHAWGGDAPSTGSGQVPSTTNVRHSRSGQVPSTLPMVAGQVPPSIASQDIKFTHLSIEDGLPHNNVRTILQDRHGFMWFGTADGLARYDGYNFKVFKHDPTDLSSMSDSYVRALHEDSGGDLWIATNVGGLNKFDPITETFTRYIGMCQ